MNNNNKTQHHLGSPIPCSPIPPSLPDLEDEINRTGLTREELEDEYDHLAGEFMDTPSIKGEDNNNQSVMFIYFLDLFNKKRDLRIKMN